MSIPNSSTCRFCYGAISHPRVPSGIPLRHDCARLVIYRLYPLWGPIVLPDRPECRLTVFPLFASSRAFRFTISTPNTNHLEVFRMCHFWLTFLLTISPLKNLAPPGAFGGYLCTVLAYCPAYRFTFLPFPRARRFSVVSF